MAHWGKLTDAFYEVERRTKQMKRLLVLCLVLAAFSALLGLTVGYFLAFFCIIYSLFQVTLLGKALQKALAAIRE